MPKKPQKTQTTRRKWIRNFLWRTVDIAVVIVLKDTVGLLLDGIRNAL